MNLAEKPFQTANLPALLGVSNESPLNVVKKQVDGGRLSFVHSLHAKLVSWKLSAFNCLQAIEGFFLWIVWLRPA